jgi:hypothetical protein
MSTINDEVLEVEDTPEVAVQKAYDAALSSRWTISRQSAAMNAGCSILSGVFGPELRSLQTRGTYPNALHDVILVLHLISLEPEKVIDLLAYPNKKQVIADAYVWAEKEGITYGSAKYLEGVRTLTEIVGSIFSSFYAVESTSKKEPTRPNGSEPHGKLPLQPVRSKRRVKVATT